MPDRLDRHWPEYGKKVHGVLNITFTVISIRLSYVTCGVRRRRDRDREKAREEKEDRQMDRQMDRQNRQTAKIEGERMNSYDV